MYKYIRVAKNINKTFISVRRYCDSCAPEAPPTCPCPPSPPCTPCTPLPMYHCNPRTKYDVNFIYINDKPPSTALKDFVDRTAQILFWTELIRGENLKL